MADKDESAEPKSSRARSKKTTKKKTAAKKAGKATSGTRRGNGAGWGGPKKGAAVAVPAHIFAKAGPGRGHYSIKGEGRLERQARHAEEMRQLYYDVAANQGVQVETRLKAATHLLDRTEGLPVQKVVQATTDPIMLMPDAELDAERKRLEDKVKSFQADAEGDAPKP